MSRSATGRGRERGVTHGLHRAAHHEVDFDLDLDATAAHQQFGFAGIGRRRMCLEPSLLQSIGGLPECRLDARERFVTRQRVIGENQIKVYREARHVAYEQVDRRAALQREGIVHEH